MMEILDYSVTRDEISMGMGLPKSHRSEEYGMKPKLSPSLLFHAVALVFCVLLFYQTKGSGYWAVWVAIFYSLAYGLWKSYQKDKK